MTDHRPLVIITDETLLDEVLRAAAATGCELHRAPDPLAVRAEWIRAPLVLIDEHVLATGFELPRRADILLITKGPPAAATWERAFEAGVQQVLSLPDAETALMGAFADVVEGPGEPGGCVIGVLGGRGGAGASVFATALALGGSGSGSGALLVDCDPLGGGIDLLLGAEFQDGSRWSGLRLDGGRVSMSTLEGALPSHSFRGRRLPFVSCEPEGAGPTPEAIASVVDAGRRAGRLVVCDLPRNLDACAEAVLDRADLLVLVVPAEIRSCVSARGVLGRLGTRAGRVRLVVRGPSPGGLAPADVADAVKAPLLVSMASERNLGKALDAGQFPFRNRGPLAMAAQVALAALRAELGVIEAAA
ncbi:helicase [Amycolatopsis acidicola]|uniref:Helicase n=1 Tax=Amycolatopsis acidicola TaxID=2596893 RepID=A0A5N0UNM7_9PSEU|nr:septum site-determining protein Ssd [Amycolatopsis acidicola]KAA9149490.1 helicase [Amycolatopsis acidicola]